ncbi:hypothetical protein ACVWWG_005897 [Bradyrhizobium sp. LB7.2]
MVVKAPQPEFSLPGIWFTKSDRPARTGPGVVSVKEEFNACALTCARHE